MKILFYNNLYVNSYNERKRQTEGKHHSKNCFGAQTTEYWGYFISIGQSFNIRAFHPIMCSSRSELIRGQNS